MRLPNDRDRSQPPGPRNTPAKRRKAETTSRRLPAGLRRTILSLLVVSLVGTCLAALFASPLVAVRHVVVGGLGGLTPEEVAQIETKATIAPRTNLFRVSTREIIAAFKQLPCVASVAIRRRIPDRLEISVTPRVPVATLTTRNGRWELDAAAVPIRPARSGAHLPAIMVQADSVAAPGRPVDAPGVAEALSIVGLAGGRRS